MRLTYKKDNKSSSRTDSPKKMGSGSDDVNRHSDAATDFLDKDSQPDFGINKPKSGFKRFFPSLQFAGRSQRKMALLVVVFVVAMSAGVWLVVFKNANQDTDRELTKLNEALRNNDDSQAIKYAKKAIENNPDDMDTILAAANVIQESDPEEAKRLYGRALELFKQQDNPDELGKKAVTYWAAAGLAEQAGRTDEAIKYYEHAIAAADPEDSYDQYLTNNSQTALARLK